MKDKEYIILQRSKDDLRAEYYKLTELGKSVLAEWNSKLLPPGIANGELNSTVTAIYEQHVGPAEKPDLLVLAGGSRGAKRQAV